MKQVKPLVNIALAAALTVPAPASYADESPLAPVDCIDTRVGTAANTTPAAGLFGKDTEEYGQTIPAVLEPNGQTFWTAQTRSTERKCIAPYYFADTLFEGFRASHWLVGGCTQDYGSATLMPLYGSLRTAPESRATRFSHEDEVARPYYYSVDLPDEGLRAEMTGRSHSALFRFAYARSGKAYLVVQPNSDEGEGYVEIDTLRRLITGANPVHRIYQGWGEPAGYAGNFVVSYAKDIVSFGVFRGDSLLAGTTRIAGEGDIGAYIEFDVSAGEEVLAKMSTSFVDIEGAYKNMQTEIPHWDFPRTCAELRGIWERQLGLIKVETEDDEAEKLFYGSLYRASFLPREASDCDGRYPSFAGGKPVRRMPAGTKYFDDYSLWDTYRALHPLLVLLSPERSGQMMQSLVLKAEQGGYMPIFPCWGSYTAAMIGDHAAAAIGDAYVKGVRNFDIRGAYKALRRNAFFTPPLDEYRDGKGRRALASYMQYGYIPLEDSVPDAFHTREQVSRTMEYAYDDFVLAQVAGELGENNDYEILIRRAANYRNVIDPRTGYAQGRYAGGRFLDEDNAFEFTSFITEGAPCHYTWYAPQDPYGLIRLLGGREMFIAKLDSMFSERRYWHGNEPCHQVAFMYNYAGCPASAARAVRQIMRTEYADMPGGLPGNDDAGQMSAWYVFAATGLYPVCPGTPYYTLASPSFPSVTIRPDGGKPFVIRAVGASERNIYIQSASLNGQTYTRNYISHSDILNGGILELVMGEVPSETWGTRPEDCPPDVMTRQEQ
ncbi:MAG: GH92 family glycosyl hydrolase [Prevotella sp.]|nr:GH92 family glycosyl hydrolase [Prevotella sp.]